MRSNSCKSDLLFLLALSFFSSGQPQYSDLIRSPNGQKLFMAGANIAWSSFANDVGPSTLNTGSFDSRFKSIHDAGGNSARWWIFVNGSNAPAFDGTGRCTGPGAGTIQDIKDVLDCAKRNTILLNLCLWSFQMPNTTGGSRTLQDTVYTRAFISNALVPVVRALKGHPSLLSWEIFNEPEGMSPDFGTWGGWDNTQAGIPVIQRFINLCAGAIHREDPKALVSEGSWTVLSNTDAAISYNPGFVVRNRWADSLLIRAGGDPLGTLDYYMFHYYWNCGSGCSHPIQISPFAHAKSYWKLDKPVLIGEFYSEDNHGVPAAQLMTRLADSGYAGGWTWSFTDRSWASMSPPVAAVAAKYPDFVGWDTNYVVSIRFNGIPVEKNGHPAFSSLFNVKYSRNGIRVFDARGRMVSLTANSGGTGVYMVWPRDHAPFRTFHELK